MWKNYKRAGLLQKGVLSQGFLRGRGAATCNRYSYITRARVTYEI